MKSLVPSEDKKVPSEESQMQIIPAPVPFFVVIPWSKQQLNEQQRANTPHQEIFPGSKVQQCSSHQSGFGGLPLTEHHLLTAPHCCLELLAQRKLNYCRARICKRRTHHGLWFCSTYPADFGDTFDDNWSGQLVKPCWIWLILLIRKQNPESRNKYSGKGFDCWWWKRSSRWVWKFPTHFNAPGKTAKGAACPLKAKAFQT